MAENLEAADTTVGVVGLGLMGSSIIVSLLLAGHHVIAIAPVAGEKDLASARIRDQLKLCERDGLLKVSRDTYLNALRVSDDYRLLDRCELILECVVEKMETKSEVYQKIVSACCPDAIIASNTSAIPISILQRMVSYPERFIGIHWAEPAFATRFMEIVCGDQTSTATAERIRLLAQLWGKEPTLLKKDIRGFITNRLMYAVYREAFSLLEEGVATLEDLDKSYRYDEGSWVTLMGLFRRMDFTGLEDADRMLRSVMPLLSSSERVPDLMIRLLEDKSSGTQDLRGLYTYSPEEARKWEEAFARFTRDIYALAGHYPAAIPAGVEKDQKVLHN